MGKQMVYVVQAFGGCYEDKWEQLLSVTSTLEEAEKVVKDCCAKYDESNWPMTYEEYANTNYGYPDYPPEDCDAYDDPYVHVDRDGFTVEQFEEMDMLVNLRYESFSGVWVQEVELNGELKGQYWYDIKGEKIEY